MTWFGRKKAAPPPAAPSLPDFKHPILDALRARVDADMTALEKRVADLRAVLEQRVEKENA